MSDTVLLALIAMVGTTTAAILAIVPLLVKLWYDLREVHKTVNSRLDELLKSVKAEEHAKGVLQGTSEGVAQEQGRVASASPGSANMTTENMTVTADSVAVNHKGAVKPAEKPR